MSSQATDRPEGRRGRGFDNVTVKQVADAAAVSPTTVFNHFPAKESLVFDQSAG